MPRGSVFKTRNGQKWAVAFDEPPGEDGVRRQRRKQPFLTKAAAQEWLREQLGRIDNNEYVPPKRITLAEFLRSKWLPSLSSTRLRASTLDAYRRTVDRHLAPGLGGVQLSKLTADRIDRFYRKLEQDGNLNSKEARPLSAKTVKNIHGTLHVALDAARKWRYISRNPADDATPPKIKSVKARSRARTVWSPSEFRTFLAFVRGDRLRAAWELISTTGLRRGELLGLRWKDIDFNAGTIEIAQTAVVVNYEVVISEAKTEAGERRITVDAETLEILREHRRLQRDERLPFGFDKGRIDTEELVFTLPDGRPIHPQRFSSWFEQLSRRAGLPRIRLHDVRHSYASAALAAGIPMKVVSERLGHAGTGITADLYSHVLEELDATAAETVAAKIRGSA
jgi:integrase